MWDAAMRYWETLRSDEAAPFDREFRLDVGRFHRSSPGAQAPSK